MQIEVILLANAFFLAAALVILALIVFRSNTSERSEGVENDLKKIKDQIDA